MKKIQALLIVILGFTAHQSLYAAPEVKTKNECLMEISRHEEIVDGEKELFLAQCNLEDSDVDFINSYLKKYPHEQLFVRDNNLSGIGLGKLIANHNFHAINIGNNKIKPDEFDTLVNTIQQQTSIRSIDLYGDHVPGKSILELLTLPNLSTLKISDNNVTDDTVIAILNAKKIKTLELAFTKTITMKSIEALANDKTLTYLDLSFDNLTPEEISLISLNKHIQSLGLEGDIPSEF